MIQDKRKLNIVQKKQHKSDISEEYIINKFENDIEYKTLIENIIDIKDGSN